MLLFRVSRPWISEWLLRRLITHGWPITVQMTSIGTAVAGVCLLMKWHRMIPFLC